MRRCAVHRVTYPSRWFCGRSDDRSYIITSLLVSSNNVRLCDNSNPGDRRFVPELRAGRSSDGILYYCSCSLLSVNRWSVVSSSGQLTKHFLSGRLGSRVGSVLDSGAEEPGFKSQPRHCRVTVLGKLFTPIVSLFTKQRNW